MVVTSVAWFATPRPGANRTAVARTGSTSWCGRARDEGAWAQYEWYGQVRQRHGAGVPESRRGLLGGKASRALERLTRLTGTASPRPHPGVRGLQRYVTVLWVYNKYK